MNVLFVAGFGPISRDPSASTALYRETMGVPLESDDGAYWHTGELPGVRHFASWPLAQAAESCFGAATWPEHLPEPHAWIEFDVVDVASASAELVARGYTLLVENKTEPWGQVVTRFLDPDGLLVGLTYTPWMRDAPAPAAE